MRTLDDIRHALKGAMKSPAYIVVERTVLLDLFWHAEKVQEQVAAERERCAKVCDDEDQELAYSGQNDNWKARQDALKLAAASIRKVT